MGKNIEILPVKVFMFTTKKSKFIARASFHNVPVCKALLLLQETKQINLVVQARDNGTVPLTANTTVSAIIVKRQNLFPPSFSQQSFSVSWSESIARQTALLNISATAGSSTSSQLLIFSIVGGSTMFSIESKGMTGNGQMQYGILRNDQPLDYETARSHEISVRATV